MDVAAILALLKTISILLPAIAEILPIAEKIVNGKTVSAADAALFWSVVASLEDIAAKKAAEIEARP